MNEKQPALFEGIPETEVPTHGHRETGTIRDKKGRTSRHKPWWMLLGRGPEDKTCGDCTFLKRVGHEGQFFKCGRQLVTFGPGTDIRKKDEACRLFQQVAK